MFCLGCIISVIDECKVRGFTQAKIVEVLLKSIDEGCLGIDDVVASNLARGAKNPSGYVMEALTKITPDAYGSITSYFNEYVVPLINENERSLVRDVLIKLIQDTPEIEENTVVEIVTGIKKSNLSEHRDDLAAFLAGLFLYALKNTKNNVKGKAKTTVKKYLNKIKNDVRKPIAQFPGSFECPYFSMEQINVRGGWSMFCSGKDPAKDTQLIYILSTNKAVIRTSQESFGKQILPEEIYAVLPGEKITVEGNASIIRIKTENLCKWDAGERN